MLWAVSSGGPGDERFTDLALDKTGKNIQVCGSFLGVAVLGSHKLDSKTTRAALVARLDTSGKFLWVSRGKGSYNDTIGITIDGSGNTYVIGTHFSGAIFGGTTLGGSGALNVYLAKLSPSGKFLWATGIGPGQGGEIALSSAGHILATGEKQVGGGDILVARLDPKGKVLGTITAGSTLQDLGLGIGLDSAGNIHVMGLVFHDGQLKINTGTAIFGKKTFNLRGRAHLVVWKMPPGAL